MTDESSCSDSQLRSGGSIPGSPGIPAYFLYGREPSPIPVLIAVPHAGRTYPRALLDTLRHGEASALRLEDRHVDVVARQVAQETGARLLVANAPRAVVDLNRAPDDVDWEMLVRADRPGGHSVMPSRRARSGLGLIPRRLPGIGELWRRRIDASELAARIDNVHAPYHAALAEELEALRERWGAVLLIDLHSMPPLLAMPALGRPEIVIGDRFGASCHGSLIAAAFSHFAAAQREAAHNRPYAGGYVLERHANPHGGINALQIEIDRSSYLDADLREPGPGFTGLVEDLCVLVRRLAVSVSDLGQGGAGWSLVAE